MQPGWCQPIRQEFMENECEALPGVAYPGVRDNRSTINTKTGYDDDDDVQTKTAYKFSSNQHDEGYCSIYLRLNTSCEVFLP